MKPVLGVIVGFILWSALWLGLNQLLLMLGVLTPGMTEPMAEATPLVILLVGSVIMSLLSGYVSARIAGPAWAPSAAALGVLLLLTGIYVQITIWDRIPLWYHLSFLILLIPITLLGARIFARSRRLA